MSKTKIPENVKVLLWVRSGGRCEFPGCDKPLWRDDLTMARLNTAHIAHIIGDRKGGPRGDEKFSPELGADFDNLMLMCMVHHKLIDDPSTRDDYPDALLREWKHKHEQAIELLTSIDHNYKTMPVIFTDNIGDRLPRPSIKDSLPAVLPMYPTDRHIEIDLTRGAFRDHETGYFQTRQEEVTRLVETHIRQRCQTDNIVHLSVFAAASMPLLIHFGWELGSIIPSEVYQLHRDSKSWKWHEPSEQDQGYIIEKPSPEEAADTCTVALNLSLSGVIQPEEIAAVMTEPYCTYRVTIPCPGPDFLKSREQLDLFAGEMRALLTDIRTVHKAECAIHLFPAVPLSIAVKLGQILLPKADPPMNVYELQNGNFRHALTVPRRSL